jgi:hypothetical protein
MLQRNGEMEELTNRGHYIWVDFGGKLGFRDVPSEKAVFQKLLDGGVYIVSPGPGHLCLGSKIAHDHHGQMRECHGQEATT